MMKAAADDFGRTKATVVLLLVLCLTACGNAADPEMKELTGRFSGTRTIVGPGAEGSLDRCNANAAGDGEHLGFSRSGFEHLTGEFTVLGRVTIVGSGCVYQEGGRYAQGRATLTTAGGDMLRLESDGSFRRIGDSIEGIVVVGRAEYQIVGGTGRFADAEGAFVCAVHADAKTIVTSEATGDCHGEMRL